MKQPLPTKLKNALSGFSLKACHKILMVMLFLSLGYLGMAQDPVITVRFANPVYDCNTGDYCLDVEFQSDTPGQQLDGMNVRFWYDDSVLEFSHFADFQGGYGETASGSGTPFPVGPAWFGFTGDAELFNGAISLVNMGAPTINISTTGWTKLFQVCFQVDGPVDDPDFCPSVIWNLKENPDDGSFLLGPVILTVVDMGSGSNVTEAVEPFNWDYDGIAGLPYGAPVENDCVSTVCGSPGNPEITVQFANPIYDCNTDQYCVDVEMQSNTSGAELYDMNVRFFYDEDILTFSGAITNLASGYSSIAPNPPSLTTLNLDWFSFSGDFTYVNGAIQVDDPNNALEISTSGWTPVFEVCFDVDIPATSNFCPSIVWDLEEDPADLSFIDGSDGLVINLVDPDPGMTVMPSDEMVNQFNWAYNSGLGSPPYGAPVEMSCISTICDVPVITAQFANPVYDCDTDQYCLDVELQSNTAGQELYDMNVRFFYDEDVLTYSGSSFVNLVSGYSAISPNPPALTTLNLDWFSFSGDFTYVNGAIQVDDPNNALEISSTGWTKIFEVCFDVDGTVPDDSFCPSVVWDLEEDPADLSFIDGSDGLVINLVDPAPGMTAQPAVENVNQFNWAYDGGLGSPPYGAPVDNVCISTRCYDLSLDKSVDDAWVDPGDQVTFTINVQNTGPDDATGVEVTDLLPSGFLYDSHVTMSGTYNSGSGAWNIGTVTVGQTVTLTITATVNGSGDFTNLAEVTNANGQDDDSDVNNGVDTDGDSMVEDDPGDEDDGDGVVVNICSLTVDAGSPQTVCQGMSVTLSGSGAVSYSWDNGVTDGVPFVPTVTTTYTVTGTDANGCEATDQVTITVQEPLDPGENGTLSICQGETVTAAQLFAALGGTPDGGGTWTPALGGENTYTYTHPATGACPAVSAEVDVSEILSPQLDPVSDVTACDSYALPAISGTNLTGNEAYYDDSQANNGQPIAGPITSTMTVWIYDETGTMPNCSDETSFLVTIVPSPVLDAVSDVTACDSYALPTISGTNLTGNEAYYDDSQANNGQPIAGPITSTMTVWIYDETGTMPNCSDETSFVVTINDGPVLDAVSDVTACDSYALPAISGTNLTGNEAYYDDSQANNGQPIAGPITSTMTVWIYDETGTMPNCSDETSFVVTINDGPVLDAVSDVTACDSYALPAISGTNLTGNEAYYDDSQANNGQPIAGPITSTMTVWIYDETGTMPNCSDETSFVVTINDGPVLDAVSDVTACDSYALPAISGTNLTGNEAYYDDSQANNGQPIAGPITSTMTVWIYDETGTMPNCSDETSFLVTIVPSPVLDAVSDVTACDSYALPAISGTNLTGNEAYYDDSQANNGQPIAGPITSTMTVWIYDETGTMPNCSDETSFVVTINDGPVLDAVSDVTACDSYALPAISGTNLTGNEAYYDDSQANNGQPIAGPITSTMTVWIYDETGTMPNCSDETSFLVTIVPSPVLDAVSDVTACDSYALPTISGTNLTGNEAYYDDSQANNGQPIAGPITSTMTVWIYDETGTIPNCSDETSFLVTIVPSPVLDAVSDVTACDSYALPAISGTNLTGNEAYYDDSQANNGQPIAGPITSTMTVWIYDETGTMPNCSDETSFVVTINTTPLADSPGNEEACDSYTLPVLTNGDYYATTGGVDPIAVGTTITNTQTIYVFSAGSGSCPDVENSFVVTIEESLDPGEDGTLSICAGETVSAALLFGSLGGTPDGGGTWSPSLGGEGIYTYTHFATSICPPVSAQVVVSEIPTPQLDAVSDVTACDSYDLPAISGTNLTSLRPAHNGATRHQPKSGLRSSATVWHPGHPPGRWAVRWSPSPRPQHPVAGRTWSAPT